VLLFSTREPNPEEDSAAVSVIPIPKVKKEQLRERLRKNGATPKKGRLALRDYYVRSNLLRAYVASRAEGSCEYCQKEAPFLTADDIPFLEVHYIFRLADDGPDSPENVAALCPNCHRMAHHGKDQIQMRTVLSGLIRTKEHQ
jgi:5-methylcytosine-specific restriction enzyme A